MEVGIYFVELVMGLGWEFGGVFFSLCTIIGQRDVSFFHFGSMPCQFRITSNTLLSVSTITL